MLVHKGRVIIYNCGHSGFSGVELVQHFKQFQGLSMGALIAGLYEKFCVEEREIYE